MNEPHPSGNRAAALFLLLMLATSGVSVYVIFSPSGRGAARRPAPAARPRPEAAPRPGSIPAPPEEPAPAAPSAPADARPIWSNPDRTAAPGAPASPSPRGRETEDPPREPGLGSHEMAELSKVSGPWNDRSAYRMGGDRSLLVRGVVGLLRFPKVVSFVLDNEWVVKGFMDGRAGRFCNDAQALAGYLSDAGSPSGVGLYQNGFKAAFKNPAGLDAILGSRLAATVMTRCSAVAGVTRDPDLVLRIAQGNPEVLLMLSDPVLVESMSRAPAVMEAVSNFQNTWSASAPARLP